MLSSADGTTPAWRLCRFFLAWPRKKNTTAACKQSDMHLHLTEHPGIEQLQVIPTVSHFQSLGFRASIKVQFSSQEQVILDLCCKTAFKAGNVMGWFDPVQEEQDSESVSQIGCINVSIRELLSKSVPVSTAGSLMLQECLSYSSKTFRYWI